MEPTVSSAKSSYSQQPPLWYPRDDHGHFTGYANTGTGVANVFGSRLVMERTEMYCADWISKILFSDSGTKR